MLGLLLAGRLLAQTDPFEPPSTMTDNAAFSCQTLTANSGFIVDSLGVTTGDAEAGQGHVRSNGDVTLNGAVQVRGDAIAGPGKQVRLNGGAIVTGARTSAATLANCTPIDLTAVLAALLEVNDDASIPRSAKGRAVLGGSDGRAFTLNAGDSLALPAGTYLLSSLTVNGSGLITVLGEVRILCTGVVSLNGGARVNAAGNPWLLRLWSSGTGVSLNGGTVVRGLVYGPRATITINGGASLTGGVFGKSVVLNGSSFLYRSIRDQVSLVVSISSPQDGASVHGCAVPVTGEVTGGSGDVAVTVNGAAAAVAADRTFTANADLSTTPVGRIVAIASDADKGSATASVQATVLPPLAVLAAPAPGALVGQQAIDLAGTCIDATAVTVNGLPAAVADDAWLLPQFDLGMDGVKELAIVASNCAGATTRTATLDLDTMAPSIAIETPPDGSLQPSGSLSVSGAVADPHLASVTVNGLPAAVAGGRFTASSVPLAEGTNDLTAIATDQLGHTSSAHAGVERDSSPPVITILAPAPDAVVGVRAVTISGTAADPHLASVTVRGQPAALSGNSFSLEVVPLDVGPNQIEVIATDTLGNSATSRLAVLVDDTPPAASIDLPAVNAGGCLPAAQAVTISGSYLEPHPASAATDQVVAVRLEVTPAGGEKASYTATLAADGRTWSVAGVDLGSADGIATATAFVADALGNTASISRSWSIDATPPGVAITLDGAPFPGSAAGAAPPAGAQAVVLNRAIVPRAEVTDGPAQAPVATLTLDGAPYLPGTTITAEGEHLLVAAVTDCAGHAAAAHAFFRLDLTPPALHSTTPDDGAALTDGPQRFAGVADDDLASALVSGLAASVAASGSFTLTPFPWVEGENTVVIELTDVAGNIGRFIRHFTVHSVALRLDVLDGGLPIAGGATYLRPLAPVLRANEPTASVTARLNGAPFSSGSTIAATGDYTLAATATDALGRTASVSVSFHVDLEAGPTVTLTSPADGAVVAGPTVTTGGTVSGRAPAVAVNGVTALVSETGWTATGVPVETGVTSTLTAVATDVAGRHAQASVTVFVPAGGPRLVILEPADGALITRSRVDVAGVVTGGRRATADGVVSVLSVAARVAEDGSFRALDVPLVEGPNTLVAETRDAQGRVGRAAVQVTADRTPPTIAVLADAQPLSDAAAFADAVTLRVEAADNLPGVAPPLVRLNGGALAATAASVETVVDQPGGYTLSVTARDAAGNEARAERSFSLGGGTCTLSDLDPAGETHVVSEAISVRGRTANASAVTVRVPASGHAGGFDAYPARLADGTFLAGDVPLPLVGENVLQVTCSSTDGSTASQTLVVVRLPAGGGPIVTLTTPSGGARVDADTVAASGTVSDHTAAVTVNGVATPVTAQTDGSGSFVVPSLPLVEGPNVVWARAVDAAGRAGTARVVVWRDSTAPNVRITSPGSQAHLGALPGVQATLDVSGVVDLDNEPNLVSVLAATTQGSVSASVEPVTGKFVALAVPLDGTLAAAQPQAVTVTAADTLGHVGRATVDLLLDPSGPALLLTMPDDLTRCGEASPASLAIAGEAWARDGAQIAVNGTLLDPATLAWDVAGTDGRRHLAFTASSALPESDGTFTVTARVNELDGRFAESQRTLAKDTVAPGVVELVPADGSSGVDAGTLVMALLSEPVQHASLAAADGMTLTRLSTGEPVVAEAAFAGDAVALVPGAALAAGERYRLRVGTGVTDLAGHALAVPAESTFAVAASALAAAPTVDPLPDVVCAASVGVSGATTPGVSVRVQLGGETFTATAGADGRFRVDVPLPGDGYLLLRVQAVDHAGNVGAETTVSLRVDCGAPEVTGATLDRGTGVLRVAFSEAMEEASVALGSAVTVCDAELAATCENSAGLTWSEGDTVLQVVLAGDATGWWRERAVRLVVGPPAADASGNALAAAFQTVLFPAGAGGLAGSFLAGEAYDDASGRPLGEVRVRLFDSGSMLPGTAGAGAEGTALAETLTDGRGRFTFAGEVAAGRYALLLEKNGYSRVVRRLALEPAIGAVPFDSRLTPLAAPSGELDPLAGGRFDGAAGTGVVLAVAAGATSAVGPLAVRLTPLSDQGLPEPLPLGWTPLAAAELRLEQDGSALPEGGATPFAAGGVTMTLPLPPWADPSEALVAAVYQLRSGLWVAIASPERLDGGLARVALPGPGVVVLVRADEGVVPPPLPTAPGQPLLGVTLPAPLPPLSAALALDPPVVPPAGRARARVVARSADGVSAWPSGLAVQAVLAEKLVLAGGGELLEAPLVADLVLYRPALSPDELGVCAAGAAGATTFMVSPSERATQVLLETGWEDVRLYPFPEQLERGSVLSPVGGSVASPDGVELLVPEGALGERVVITAHLLSAGELASLPLVPGFATVAAVRVELAGQTLARPATIGLDAPVAAPPETPGDPRLLLAELVEQPADGGGAFARLAARIARQTGAAGAPDRLVAAPEPATSELSLDGVVREGVYLVLAAEQPIGFATGLVHGAGTSMLTGARVAAAGLGTADLSRDGGRYALPVLAGPVSAVTATHPTLDERGSASIAALAPGAVVAADITVRTVPPALLPPPVPVDGATAPVGTPVSVSFSKALDPASVTAATLTLELASAAGEPTGAVVTGTVSLVGGVTVSFAPSYPLPPGRRFIARFSGGVRDRSGTPYDGPLPFVWRFATSTAVITAGQVHPERFHVRLPVGGVAAISGDAGAVPAGWTVTPEVEGAVADTQRDSFTATADGSFGGSVGHPPAFLVTIASVVWVRVIDALGGEAARFRLGPFVSPDGLAFVAPAGQATTFTTRDGVTVEVPEAAFSQATLVTITTLDPAALGLSAPPGMALASAISVEFAGTAMASLVLRVPAPDDAPDDAMVAVGAPVDLPWGRKLRLLAIGGVLSDGGRRYLSNDPSVVPEPEQGETTGAGLRAPGSGPSVRALGGPTRRTCRDAKQSGLSQCFLQSLLMEFSATTNAAWFWGMGSDLSLVTGMVSSELAQQFSVVYNEYADAWVYLPVPYNWSGRFVLPVLKGSPLRIVERDRATGWIVGTKDYDPILPSAGGFFGTGTLPGERPRRPLLVAAAPFDLVRFRAPARSGSERLRLEVEARADSVGTVRLAGVQDLPLADGTELAVFDLAPSLPSDPAAQPQTPRRGPVFAVCGRDTSWTSPQFPGSDELLLVVAPGDLEAERFEAFELEFDRRLTDLSSTPAGQVVRLEDLGETTSCAASGGGAKAIALDLEQPATSGRTHLRVRPNGALPAGHRFRLTLQFAGITSEAADGTQLTYWPDAPTVFEFGTRKVPGDPIGSVEPGMPSLGDSDEARDLLRFGNLVLVGSASGRIVAFDTSDHSELGRFTRFAIANGAATQVRAFATDGHNRLFFNALAGSTWEVKALRLEDVRGATAAACSGQPAWASSLPCFASALGGVKIGYTLGTDSDLTASEWLALQAMPVGIPTDMEVLSQDEEGRALDLARFFDTYGPQGASLEQLTPDAEGIYSIDVTVKSTYARGQAGEWEPSQPHDTPKPDPLPDWRKGGCAGEPVYDRYQRVTVDNLTTGQAWSVDVENPWPGGAADGSYHLVGLRARRNDQLRVRYNLRALGYVVLTGSGITVVDLNRFYRLAQPPGGSGGGQCERRLASYQGQAIEFPACAYPGGDPANAAALDGLPMTSALAVHSGTGCTGVTCAHGATSIDVYSPLVHIGAVHTTSAPSAPGDLRPAGVAGCLRSVKGTAVQLRDAALANDLTWIDRGITGTLAGVFTPAPAFTPKDTTGDLLFLTLGSAGIYVFDVTQRRVDESTLIGHLRVDGHTASRLEVDRVRSLLFAGGTDADGASIIDVWDLRAVNGAPGLAAEPRPSLTVKAPWTTNHLGLDPLGTELVYTWGGSRGPLAVPIGSPRFVFSGLYLPEEEDMPSDSEQRPHAVERITSGFAPLGVPVRIKPPADEQQVKQDREADDRKATAALKLRVALPGSFGEQLTAKVQSLRVLPEADLLGYDEVGGAEALPGGEGWLETSVVVHLHRVGVGTSEPDAGTLPGGEAGQLATVFNLYESAETVLLLADPRARRDYHLQSLGARPGDLDDSDEAHQCRRCAWPSYLPDPKDGTPDEPAEMKKIKELLAGGPYLRAVLAIDPDAEEPVRAATQKAINFFHAHEQSYPAPTGVARVAAWADTVPSPIQASLAEPVQNAASWSPGEAGTAVSLASGDALLSATDFTWAGRMLPVSLDRAYRSGTLGYGALGAAGWHSGLLAHLRENGVTGEVEYRDGSGAVHRFYPRGGDTPSDQWEDDPSGSYQVPKGLYLRLKKLGGGQGWQLIGRTHDVARFDAEGRLTELSDRLRQNKPATEQGNTIRFSYDAFGQLTGIEDDLGRQYQLEYFDDPKPESDGGDGPRYGLLKKVTDFAKRTVEYEYDTERRLTKVKLPEVTTTAPEYGQYAFTGSNRPTVEYRYEPSANVTSSKTDTTAILHGDFAKLRLEGFKQPGSDVLRARFEYESTTGRVKTVAFPDASDANSSGGGVQWKVEYPSEASTAAPVTKAAVKAPWSHDVAYTVDKGRTTKVEEANIEALAASDTTPAVGGGIPTKTLTTSLEHEDDGRLKKLTAADGSLSEYAYSASADLLAKANVTTLTERVGSAAKGPVSYTDTVTSFGYSGDNLIESTTDAKGRLISAAIAPGGGGPVESGYHAESVLATSTFDLYGRVSGSQTAGAAPVISSLVFGQDKSGRANAGLLESITAGGFTETFRYDDWDQVKESSTSYGASSTFTNDEWDRSVDEENGKSNGALAPVNAKAQRAFDAAGRLVRERWYQTGIGWVESRYEYNARDQVKSVTQTGLAGATPGGGFVEGTTTYSYDTYGRLTTTMSPAGIVTTTSYDSAGRVASTRTGASGTRTRGYDELGRLVFTSDGDQGFWRGRFDGWGRMYEEQSASSALIEREHDRAGGLTRVTAFADAGKANTLQETLFDVASFGGTTKAEQKIFGGGSPSVSVYTTNTFDGSGRIVQTTYGPAGAERVEQAIGFEPGTGRTSSVADAVGNRTSFSYTSGAPWADSVTSSEAGASGVTITSALGLDAFGRTVRSSTAGTTIERRLDEAGNLLSVSIGGGNRQDLTYDARGLLVSARKPAISQEVLNAFDLDGRMTLANVARAAAGFEQTSYVYDISGRLSSRTRPSSPTESFSYNADDTVATATTRQGLLLTYGYDAANRITSIVPSGSVGGAAHLAPLDGGDVMAYDPLGRLSSIGIAGRPGLLVTYSELDSRGLPRVERVASWPVGAAIERSYDAFGNTTSTRLPQGIAGTISFPGFTSSYDALDRMTSSAPIEGGAVFGATLGWGGQARPLAISTSTGLSTGLGYDPTGGRLASLSFSSGEASFGTLRYGWDTARDLKVGREAPAGSTPSVLSSLGWAASYDAVHRVSHAETGQGNVAGAASKGAALGAWTYGLGKADELVSVDDAKLGRLDYTSGPEGRIAVQSGPDGSVPFAYDLEGRRIEDDRYSYTWDWRGRLVEAEPKTGEHAAERLAYTYDGAGRLLSTTNLGTVPDGGGEADRPFVAKRAYVWDGQRLAATAGLNFEDQPIWRYQYTPGHRWLDDAPQVRVEKDLLGTPSTSTFDLFRDEMGSVLAVTEARPGQSPRLLARFLSSPYGEQHVELGPELVHIAFDDKVTELGSQQQEPVAGESVGGALRVVTTVPLDPASLAAGIGIEEWVTGSGWTLASRGDYAVATDPADATSVLILRLPAWPKGARCRVTLTSGLADFLGRALRLPERETGGVRVVLEVPGDGQAPPVYDRQFELTPDENPAGNTLGGELPGGLGQGFQGLLADGATGLLHAHFRVFDPHTASWLSPDPLGLDSPNSYAPLTWQPTMAIDPLGLQAIEPVPCPPQVSAARCLELQRLAEQAEAQAKANRDFSVLSEWGVGVWRTVTRPFKPIADWWTELPEDARKAGQAFWRYEPQVSDEQRELGLDYGARSARELSSTMGQITGGAAAVALEAGQTIIETELGGRLVRAVVGAGGKVVRVIDDLGPARGPGRYVAKKESMAAEAKALEERVAYGRPGQAYRIPYENPRPGGRPWVDVDGAAPNGLPIDAKLSIVTRPKTVDQAARQAAAYRQRGTIGVWKVTSLGEAVRARRMIEQADATDVIRVVVER